MRKLFILLILFGCVMPISRLQAQFEAKCGDIIEAEFKEERKIHVYAIDLEVGDKLKIAARPSGDTLQLSIVIRSPTKRAIADNDPAYYELNYAKPELFPIAETKVVAAPGTYSFVIGNSTTFTNGEQGTQATSENPSGIGLYKVSITCTKADGRVINPGETTQPSNNNNNGATANKPAFSGNGFPGLDPVDFSNVAKIPLASDFPMGGAITPTGNEIIGYTIDGKASNTLDLSFMRTAGNLNLGIVILSADNKVVFQASLINTKQLTADVTLPSDGQYTIGVFRVDLVPPVDPQATAFQIQVSVK